MVWWHLREVRKALGPVHVVVLEDVHWPPFSCALVLQQQLLLLLMLLLSQVALVLLLVLVHRKRLPLWLEGLSLVLELVHRGEVPQSVVVHLAFRQEGGPLPLALALHLRFTKGCLWGHGSVAKLVLRLLLLVTVVLLLLRVEVLKLKVIQRMLSAWLLRKLSQALLLLLLLMVASELVVRGAGRGAGTRIHQLGGVPLRLLAILLDWTGLDWTGLDWRLHSTLLGFVAGAARAALVDCDWGRDSRDSLPYMGWSKTVPCLSGGRTEGREGACSLMEEGAGKPGKREGKWGEQESSWKWYSRSWIRSMHSLPSSGTREGREGGRKTCEREESGKVRGGARGERGRGWGGVQWRP